MVPGSSKRPSKQKKKLQCMSSRATFPLTVTAMMKITFIRVYPKETPSHLDGRLERQNRN